MSEDAPVAVSGRKNLKLVFRLVSTMFVLLCLAFVAHLLVGDWSKTSAALRHAKIGYLVPAVVCAIGGMCFLAWRWEAAIAAVGGERTGSHRVISAFFVG